MKSKLLIMTLIGVIGLSLGGFAQTKGTNAIGFGITMSDDHSRNSNTESKVKDNFYILSYGNFIKNNTKLGIDLNYGTRNIDYSSNNSLSDHRFKSYGGNVTYQKYYPLVKTLYAYAGGRGGYNYSSDKQYDPYNYSTTATNTISVGAFGGITWFLSKRFAFETTLLSASAFYSKTNDTQSSTPNYLNTAVRRYFNVSSDGFINNLGFKIYILL